MAAGSHRAAARLSCESPPVPRPARSRSRSLPAGAIRAVASRLAVGGTGAVAATDASRSRGADRLHGLLAQLKLRAEPDPQQRTAARRVARLDEAAVCLHRLAHDRQPQTGARL